MIAVKARGHLREKIAVRQQVTRHLLRHKPVKRHVVVECLDQPIAPHPHVAQAIVLVSVRVRIARGLQPIQRHVLAVARRRQQSVDCLLVSLRRSVFEESVQFCNRRWQSGQIKSHSPQQGRLVRGRRRLQGLAFQPCLHKGIDAVAPPRGILHLRQRRPFGRHKRPMPVILRPGRASLQPLRQLRPIRRAEIAIRIRWRHLHIRIGARQALKHFPLGNHT